MSTNSKKAPTDGAEVNQADQDVTLHEFCLRLSAKDKRVELISAFHFTEQAAGTIKDTEAAFASRFSAFINKPVN